MKPSEVLTAHWCCGNRGPPPRRRPADARARRAVDPGQRPVHRRGARRAARPHPGRRTPPPRPPARGGRRRGRASRARRPPAGAAARPRSSRSPRPAATTSTSSTTTSPSRRCASSPRPAATTPSGSSPTRRVGRSSRTGSHDVVEPQPELEPGRGAGPGLHRRGVRRLGARRCRSGEQLCQQHCPVSHVAHEFPQLCEAETEAIGRVLGRHVQRLATIAHGDGVCTTCIPTRPEPARTDKKEQVTRMTSIEELNPELEGIGRYEFGWADSDDAGATAKRGLNEDVVRDISSKKNEPQWMLDLRLKGLKLFHRKPMPTWGSDLSSDRLRQHQVLRPLQREAGRHLGGPARGHQEHLRQARHPRGGEAAPGLRCRRAVRVRGRLPLDPRGPRGAGRPLPRHRHRAARAPGALPGVLRHRHPGRRQQVRRAEHLGVVRRLVHLRAEGRARRHPAAGLLPDQHREHGPVRADPDHRRRGRLRALRRGLHRADLLLRLAALRGRRDHREEGRPLPLHDHPELVEQRLQPRHQARDLRGRRDHGVGRRQHRLQGDDEVPRHLPDGRARQGRDAVDRVRGRGPAPGRRRQDGARRAAHLVLDPVASRWRAAAAGRRTAA